MKITNKKYTFLFSIVIVFILVFFLVNSFDKDLKIESNPYDQKEQLIVSLNSNLNYMLDIKDDKKYNIIGHKNGESLFAFNNISYGMILNRLSHIAETDVIKKELFFRDYINIKNNIAFFMDDDFSELQEYYNNQFVFVELEEKEVKELIPELEEQIEKWLSKDYQTFNFYKINKEEQLKNKKIETIYVVGGNAEEELKVLEVYYFINGEYSKFVETVNLEKEIEDLKINTFNDLEKENSNIKDSGNSNAIVNRRENYQGSKPYVEQNFQENDKVFEKGSH